MIAGSDLAKCLSFISCQVTPPGTPAPQLSHSRLRPAIAMSRLTGSGAMKVAQALAAVLQERAPGPCGWAVFDRNIVAKMLEEHQLPAQLAQFLPEDRISKVRDVVEELLGLHPPSETLVRKISETVVHLAELGHVILVGRAANVITRHLKNVFHVRLVAPLDQRVARVAAAGHLTQEAALDVIHREDAGRKRYLKVFFEADPDDVMLYDLVVNTGRLAPESVARLIAGAVLDWVKKSEAG